MSAYDWPRIGRPPRVDDRDGRDGYNARRGAFAGGELLTAARPPEPRLGRAPDATSPTGAADLWAPIGPTTVLGGHASGTPRVTGRIDDVAVEPTKGRRAYAAAATGGVWYTDDGGATWRALGGWRTADPTAAALVASPLANGCLLVEFGKTGGNDDPTKDEVWVGTGEAPLLLEGTPGDQLPGVGVLHAIGPSTRPETDPVFTVEATNLLGAALFALARQPSGPGLVAASTAGLVERPAGAGPHPTWDKVPGLPTGGGGSALACTDTVWTGPAGGQPGRLWAALRRPASDGMELWWRADGTSTFTRVTLPAGALVPTPPVKRLVLAASPSGDIIWALGDGPRLWRIDATVATPAGKLVKNIPALWDGSSIKAKKMALSIDPSNAFNVALGGTVSNSTAALFLGVVTGPAAGPFTYTAAGAQRGKGVHADILAIRFTTDGTQVWVACDGGVFVSTSSGDIGTFVARNTGLAVVEAGFVACHPDNDAAVVLGAQDNATQRRVGEALWDWEQGGDGGGIAFDQVATHRYVAQFIRADWSNGPTAPRAPVHRGPKAKWRKEEGKAEFYSMPATIANGTTNQLAVGTNRVWYTQDWGQHWVTLPNGTKDPRATGQPVSNAQDALPAARGAIRTLRFASADQLWVMCSRALYQMQRDSAGHWTRADISLEPVLHPAKKTDVAASDTCNDIAVHNPTGTPHGSLYLAMQGDLSSSAADQLWWYDGSSSWHKVGLRSQTTAAALAVAVEPGHTGVVYVGTAIGVFRAKLTFNGNDPSWSDWTRLDNGLPDVAVQDLAIFSKGPIRLLRAATQARGVWELELAGPVADRTYVRVHRYDSRRTSPSSLAAPFEAKVKDPADATKRIPKEYRWHASPDLRVHPKLGAMAAPSSLPWTRTKMSGGGPDKMAFWKLWRFQVALRNVDLRSEPTGVWNAEFDAVLRDNGVPLVAGKATITKAFWETIVVAPNLTRLPWDTAQPAEADLWEYLPAETNLFGIDGASVEVPKGRVTAYVVVHHRGVAPAAKADVQATLLYRVVPRAQGTKATAWLPDPVGWATGISNLLKNGTSFSPPTGWVLADTANPRHQPAADVAAGSPTIATFDVDFSALKANSLVLLVAVVHSANDPVSISELPLQQLTRTSPHVAVRSIHVRA